MAESVAFAGCRGWLDRGAGGRGAVICGSWGFEDLCSRRSLAFLSQTLAAAGVSALRFDYRGAGESLDLADPADLVAVWRANIAAAASVLRQTCGVSDIAFVGLRLGAAFAAEAAAELGGSRLVLLAPVLSGRAFLRECDAFARVARSEAAGADAPGASDGLDAAGFEWPEAGRAALRGFDLKRLTALPAAETLIFAPQRTPAIEAFEQRIADLGGRAETRGFDLYSAMMCDPTAAQTPAAMLREAARWLARGAPVATAARSARPLPNGLATNSWSEMPAQLDRGLTGVLTRPHASLVDRRGAARRAVVFLNAGGIRRVGWAGGHVAMARALAAAGVTSLRLDAAGVGDTPPFDTIASLFSPERRADVATAMDALCAEGAEEIVLVGACSGAHHAFHLACADQRVRAVALINMVCILWGPSYAMQLRAWRAAKATQVQARGFAAAAETRGDVAALAAVALPLAQKFARRSFGALKTLSALAGGLSAKRLVERKFTELASRGVQTRLVYSAGDPGLDELARYVEPRELLLRCPNVETHILPDADHMLTQAGAREALAAIVLDLATSSAAQSGETDRAPAACAAPLRVMR